MIDLTPSELSRICSTEGFEATAEYFAGESEVGLCVKAPDGLRMATRRKRPITLGVAVDMVTDIYKRFEQHQ